MQHVAHRHSDEIHQLRAEVERLRAALPKIAGELEQYGLHLLDRLRYLASISRENHDRGHHRRVVVLDDHEWRWLEQIAELIDEQRRDK